jgi:hypothetical protein
MPPNQPMHRMSASLCQSRVSGKTGRLLRIVALLPALFGDLERWATSA